MGLANTAFQKAHNCCKYYLMCTIDWHVQYLKHVQFGLSLSFPSA